MSRRGAACLLALLLAGCLTPSPIEQRSTQGPTAYEFWMLRMMSQLGREPSFDERRHWDDEMESRISRYLNEHPEDASALTVSTFRFYRQAAVGMSQEQVAILLGPPRERLRDPAAMQRRAGRFWPDVRERAQEAWTYPHGWTLFFADRRVVDIVQYYDPAKEDDSG